MAEKMMGELSVREVLGLLEENTGTETDRIDAIRTRVRTGWMRRAAEGDLEAAFLLQRYGTVPGRPSWAPANGAA